MLTSCIMVLTGLRSITFFCWSESPAPGQSWLARSLLCWVYLVVSEGERWSGPFIFYIHLLRLVPSSAQSSTYAGHEWALFNRTPVLGHIARSSPKVESSEKMAFLKHSSFLSRISLGRLHDSSSLKKPIDLMSKRVSPGRDAVSEPCLPDSQWLLQSPAEPSAASWHQGAPGVWPQLTAVSSSSCLQWQLQ